MSTKKWIALVIFVVTLIVALAAAYMIAREDIYITGSSGSPAPEMSASPAPTEEPAPPLVARVLGTADEGFLSALTLPQEADVLDLTLAELTELSEVDAALVYLSSPADAEGLDALVQRGIPVVAYNRCGATLADGVIEIGYAISAPATAEAALEAAIAYPPHDTPVRLFGIFESADSEAARAFAAAADAGRVLSKGVLDSASGAAAVSSWLAEKLLDYYPGMVDAAFVETPALAAAAVEYMASVDRDDFEIFTVGSDAALSDLAAKHPRILPVAIQTDDAAAAKACTEALSALLKGQTPPDVVLPAGE